MLSLGERRQRQHWHLSSEDKTFWTAVYPGTLTPEAGHGPWSVLMGTQGLSGSQDLLLKVLRACPEHLWLFSGMHSKSWVRRPMGSWGAIKGEGLINQKLNRVFSTMHLVLLWSIKKGRRILVLIHTYLCTWLLICTVAIKDIWLKQNLHKTKLWV